MFDPKPDVDVTVEINTPKEEPETVEKTTTETTETTETVEEKPAK